jgi:hypothetical protein
VSENKPKLRGLSAAINPASRMQELVQESARSSVSNETMSETSFETLKPPTSESVNEPTDKTSLEDWLASVLETAKLPVKDGTTSRLNIEIDEDMHFALKQYCVGNRVTVRRLVVELIGAYLRDTGGK